MKLNAFRLGFLATLGALAAFVLGVALSNIATILVYIAAALFIALGLDPVVRWLTRHRVHRVWAIVIVFVLFLGAVLAVFWLIVPVVITQGAQMLEALPAAIQSIENQQWFINVNASMGNVINLSSLSQSLGKFLGDPQNLVALGGGILKVGVGLADLVFGTIAVVILSLFFLGGLATAKQSLALLVPASRRDGVVRIGDQIIASVGQYVGGQVLLAASNGVLGLIAMLIFGVPFAGVLAVVAFMLALIPLVGTVISAVLITLVALTVSPTTAIAIAIYYLIYMQVEAYVFSPRVMSKAVNVPGILVVIGAMVGGTLLGVLGALIAVPVTASILIVIKQVVIPRQARA